MNYAIEYEPRVADPVIVARFETLEQAEKHMDYIKTESPKSAPYHKIIEEKNERS